MNPRFRNNEAVGGEAEQPKVQKNTTHRAVPPNEDFYQEQSVRVY
jgi:hypothetical protein